MLHTERENAPGQDCESCDLDSSHDIRCYHDTEMDETIYLCRNCGVYDRYE